MILVDRVSCGKKRNVSKQNHCWKRLLNKTIVENHKFSKKTIVEKSSTMNFEHSQPSPSSHHAIALFPRPPSYCPVTAAPAKSWLFMTSNLPPSPSLLVEAIMRQIVDATECVFFHSSIKAIVIPYMDFYQSKKKLVVPYWTFYRLIKANDSLLVLFYRLIKILMIHHLFFYRLIKIRYSRIWHFYRLIKKMIFSNIEFLWILHLEQINGYDLWFFEMQIEKSEHQISASKD